MAFGPDDRDWRGNREARNRPDPRSGNDPSHRSNSSERGFFERAGDEISSWFGDDEAERRREMDERGGGYGPRGAAERGHDPSRHDMIRNDQQRGSFGGTEGRGRPDRDDSYRRPYSGRPQDQQQYGQQDRDAGPRSNMDREQGYRPMTGDYGRSADYDRGSNDRFEQAPPRYATSGTGGGATAAHDRHYGEWRQRQIDQIDSDYEDYRREHQSKFESDFTSWRSTRQSKRDLLGQIKEHMQVLGADEQPLGTVDKVRGDRLILTKADSPDGKHHSVNAAMIAKVDGDRVILDKNAEEARAMFGNEDRDRALYERDDQREPGAHVLNRSFSGTY